MLSVDIIVSDNGWAGHNIYYVGVRAGIMLE